MGVTVKDNVLSVVTDELEALRLRIIANHEAAGQVASGRTRDSIRVERTEDGGVLWGRQAFGVLETGRKPGKVPKGFYQIIRQWVDDKGISVPNPDSFAYLVARKIATEGTEMYRTGQKKDIYSTDMEKTIREIERKVLGIFDTEVEHINLNFKNEDSRI